MVKTFIVTNKFTAYELHIDGKVAVKPLPNNVFRKATITTLAEVYEAIIDWHHLKSRNKNLEEIAFKYFENKGFEIKEIHNTGYTTT